ncbi:MAG: hypothetical protein DMF58_17640 [Acidobacteria bacterium]|nr:MAG: hypothetical protein DMF58_17640 [Acidobacteriota bacterium]
MRHIGLAALVSVLLATSLVAQNNRSAVSIAGSDAAACTVPDPCRTFAVALSKTNNDGEVVALTSGGYGPFIVDRPATIVAAPGIYAAIVATIDAVHVNAGAGAKVVIRGLYLYGAMGGQRGIAVLDPVDEVDVEHCVISGFQEGIDDTQTLRISDTTLRFCIIGIRVTNPMNAARATMNRVELRDYGTGILAAANAIVTVRDSVASRGSAVGFDAFGGVLNIENCLVVNNVIGVRADQSGTVRVSNTMATDNTQTGFTNFSSTFISWGNNKVRGNAAETSGTITVVSQD